MMCVSPCVLLCSSGWRLRKATCEVALSASWYSPSGTLMTPSSSTLTPTWRTAKSDWHTKQSAHISAREPRKPFKWKVDSMLNDFTTGGKKLAILSIGGNFGENWGRGVLFYKHGSVLKSFTEHSLRQGCLYNHWLWLLLFCDESCAVTESSRCCFSRFAV